MEYRQITMSAEEENISIHQKILDILPTDQAEALTAKAVFDLCPDLVQITQASTAVCQLYQKGSIGRIKNPAYLSGLSKQMYLYFNHQQAESEKNKSPRLAISHTKIMDDVLKNMSSKAVQQSPDVQPDENPLVHIVEEEKPVGSPTEVKIELPPPTQTGGGLGKTILDLMMELPAGVGITIKQNDGLFSLQITLNIGANIQAYELGDDVFAAQQIIEAYKTLSAYQKAA
jgi:hypothetical protein